jgi:hypothetical protein
MDIDEIRRTNIRALEKRAGSPKAAADLVSMSYAQYLNYRNGAFDSRSGKLRGMRKETAWRFDDAFGEKRGWLDTCHDETAHGVGEATPLPYIHSNATIRQIIALCEATDEAGRGMALMAVSQALERYRPVKEKAA